MKNTDHDKSRISGVKDLEKKTAVIFQNKYYYHIAFIGGFIVPFLIGLIYGRPLGAVLWGTFLRITLVHHATFLINSLCHYSGRRTYDANSSSRDSWFISLFTFGEGYHNYHHKFPSDFRNGVKWFAYDPSKWIINILAFFGITYDLRKVKDHVIWENHLNSIKTQLSEKFNQSAENCKTFYHNKVEQLHENAESVFTSWKEMERKYTNLVAAGKAKNKAILNELRKERKEYKAQLSEIKRNLNRIMLNVKRNRLRPELTF